MTALTAKDYRALAREARQLASEIAEGRCPSFVPWNWCGCAAGTVVANAGVASQDSSEQEEWASALALRAEAPLSAATICEENDHNGALVFPLLWWADDLDLAAKAAPKELP